MRPQVWWLVILALLAAGCDEDGLTSGAQVSQPVPKVSELKGQQGPFVDRGFFVIQRPETWAALWGKTPPEAAVDFDKQSVIVALMGQQRTAGYEITITAVGHTDKRIDVTVMERRPAPGEMTAQVLTYPYHMVVVPKLALPVYVTVAGAAKSPIVIQDGFIGQHCAYCDPQTIVLRDLDAWRKFWGETLGGDGDAPWINFGRFMVVGILLGEKPTTGYGVTIVSVAPDNDQVVVHYRLQTPAPGAAVDQTATSPYAIAVIPFNKQAIVFRDIANP
ncbi:MAG: protease complex subunit PrcB family protein [Armatimonadota bacterium]